MNPNIHIIAAKSGKKSEYLIYNKKSRKEKERFCVTIIYMVTTAIARNKIDHKTFDKAGCFVFFSFPSKIPIPLLNLTCYLLSLFQIYNLSYKEAYMQKNAYILKVLFQIQLHRLSHPKTDVVLQKA